MSTSIPNPTNNIHALVRKNSFYLLIERSVAPVVNLLVTIYIIRKLSVDDYGIYNILFALMGYVGLFSSFGMPHIFQRYIPEFYENKQIGELKKLVENGLFWRFIFGGGLILIIILFSNQLGSLFKFQGALQYITVFSIAIIFFLESRLLNITLTSVFRHKSYTIAQIVYVFFRAGVLYYLVKIGKGLTGILLAESLAFLFLFVLQFIYFKRFLSNYQITKKSKLPIKRLLRFGGYSYFYEIGSEILAVSTDYFIISAFLGPTAVGIYAFAARVMHLISHVLPQQIFINIIRPVFFTKYTQNSDYEQLNRMSNFLMKIIAFFSLPIVIGVLILGDKLIVYVFDPKYLESLKVLWIVVIFMSLHFFMDPVGLVLQSIEKVQIIFYSKIFAIYNLIADILVVKTFGVIGVAVATGSAVLFKSLFCYYYARKYTGLKVDFKSLGVILLNSIVMGLAIYPLRGMITSLVSFIAAISIGALVYVIMAYFNKAFSPEERETVNKIFSKNIFRF